MNRREGSLIITVLVVVFVTTSLAVSFAALVRSRLTSSALDNSIRAARNKAENALVARVAMDVAADTNEWDALCEPWAATNVADGVETIVSDESAKIPLNLSTPELIAEVIRRTAFTDRDIALALANGICTGTNRADWCDIGELAEVEGMTPAILDAMKPYVTTLPVTNLNINTASDLVLEAEFDSYNAIGSSAARMLRARIKTFRENGGYFTSADAASISAQLGTLPTDQAALLGMCAAKLAVRSDYFTVTARAAEGDAKVEASAIFNKSQNAFETWYFSR